jgi:hypothetical protein
LVSENAGRANTPDVKEIVSHIDDLKELMEEKVLGLGAVLDERELRFNKVIDERDRRYEDRFTAMDEKTSLALTASEKAVSKAETATEKRFDSVNEFRGQLKDQANSLLPREEANSRFGAMQDRVEEMMKEIVLLREFRSSNFAMQSARDDGTLQKRFDIKTLLTILSMLVAGAAIYFRSH